ncbi:PREDICTED: WD repeat-containing protein 36-like [Amphimedon queenslandica]|uniref:Uncharacterized protein n=1 Tax=Amphimedon queenslandica TaxID=400682 RepID=A0A1X7U566_AMPQE|nr:PREDICTED: WD repeat-containing protein 36-like [Amphimedon queenslandica]|eukprot:XP_019856091.1 PREDICTED: WD repeat-containing protein 36-like [Amphimedon queenslandica]
MSTSCSRLYQPFRAVGVCSNGVPHSLFSAGRQSLLATAVGRSFHVYECNKLHLVMISRLQQDEIQCLIQNGRQTVAAVGDTIKILEGGEEIGAMKNESVIKKLLSLGKDQLISIDVDNTLKVWDINKEVVVVELQFSKDSFLVTSLVHPLTYINKLLIGSNQGTMQLWNIRTSRLVHTFNGWGSPLLCLEQSTALDVVGVGLANGGVLLHNVRTDQTIMRFKQDWGPVTGLSFRTDGVDMMVSISAAGNIAVWDLNEKRLASVLYGAHQSLAAATFFNNEPIMATNGADNAIKIWIFDQSDGSARLLKERCGHSDTPTLIRFHPSNPHAIISAGTDNSLRVIGLRRQIISRELSQGTIIKKKKQSLHSRDNRLPLITDFAFEAHRAHQWDSLVSVHKDTPTFNTWNITNYCLGKHSITLSDKPVSCCISGCGHYMFIGTAGGRVFMFNIQSGLERGQFTINKKPAHKGPVRSISTYLNYIITGGADRTVKVWSYYNKRLLHFIELSSPVTRMFCHKESGLVGVACDNFQLVVIDAETGGVARAFDGPSGRITDLLISPNSRWLVVSSMDCSISTWDIPAGLIIDLFYTATPPLSLSMSSLGHFIATTHVDELGIYLWSNVTLYSSVSLSPVNIISNNQLITDLPSTGTDPVQTVSDSMNINEEAMNINEGDVVHDSSLIKLSHLPKSQWHCLQYMDTIKERNKPKDPVQPLNPAPFFLPTLPGLEMKFIPAPEPIPTIDENKDSLVPLSRFNKSSFQKLLIDYHSNTRDFSEVLHVLLSMSPSSVDAEFQLLASSVGNASGGGATPSHDNVVLFESVLQFISEGLLGNDHYELLQSYLCLLLKYHTAALIKIDSVLPLLYGLTERQEKGWKLLSNKMNYCHTLLSYCKSATV